jgi:hypothetical protein
MHRATLKADQRAPELVEVFAPRHERRSTATVLRYRALQVRHGLLQHRDGQATYAIVVEHRQAARSTYSHALFAHS